MIYKIEGEFNDGSFEKILKQIEKTFIFIYTDNTLFISLKTVKDKDKHRILMKKVFKPSSDYYVTEITEKNILRLPQHIMIWCRENFVRLEQEKFELEQQEKLKKYWAEMDELELRLSEKLKELKDTSGSSSEKK